MRKAYIISLLAMLILACSVSMKNKTSSSQPIIPPGSFEDTLRFFYSLPPEKWPAPFIDSGVHWKELGVVPASPLQPHLDSLKHLIELGKTLFFDPRLSGSNQISCASCHMPGMSWSDGRPRSIGHEMQVNKRNSPTILNTWFYKELFWDGRSKSLEDQAFSPINSETEMHSDMPEMIMKLRRVEGYRALFKAAYGNEDISPETVTDAIAVFERTLTSNKADFDKFLSGKKEAMSDAALRGLHLFRTRARCMNCHNGNLLSDDQFHNTGLTNYKGEHEDVGRYKVTHKAEDMGRFRTPSLRDVMRTRPWMHNGMFDNIDSILNMYNAGMPQQKSGPAIDTLHPKTDRLIKKLDLTKEERQDIIAFLHAISSDPERIKAPVLPK